MFVLSISTGLYFSDYLNSKIPQYIQLGPNAVVLEMVDKHGLGPCVERRKGSSPFYSTKII